MERQLLETLYRWLVSLELPRRKGAQFSDLCIVMTFLWAVLCDRPISWATCAINWPAAFAWFTPPSSSTMSRRLGTPSVQRLLAEILQQLNPAAPPRLEHWVDGKPLPVGGATKDPDARAGRGAGMMAKGYKLHALWACTGVLEGWAVEPLNVSEPKVAAWMVPALSGPGYLVGDHLFDWKVLYNLAGEQGMQLVVSPEKNGSPTPGVRRQSPHRVIGLRLAHTPQGKAMLRRRFGIDRLFGQWGNAAGGMGPLPNWVRRLPRVRRWVLAKLLWFCFRRIQKNKHL